MSDEGMSDEMLAVVRKDISSSGDFGEVAAHVAAALIARLDAAERERDALREALANMANTINIVGSPYDRIQKAADELIHDVKKRARAALTTNHTTYPVRPYEHHTRP